MTDALSALAALYQHAIAVVARALAAEWAERLHLGLEVVALRRKIDVALDAAALAPMGARPRKMTTGCAGRDP